MNDAQLLPTKIKNLIDQQQYGILCTQGNGQPYGSMMVYTFSEDLRFAAFCTPMTTRKFQLLSKCKRVSIVIDNRDQYANDVTKIEAITTTGIADRLLKGAELTRWSNALIKRYPHMKFFIHSTSCAVFKIEILRFFHVHQFQEVNQWIPPSNG